MEKFKKQYFPLAPPPPPPPPFLQESKSGLRGSMPAAAKKKSSPGKDQELPSLATPQTLQQEHVCLGHHMDPGNEEEDGARCCQQQYPEPGRMGRCSHRASQGYCTNQRFNFNGTCPVACGCCALCLSHGELLQLYKKMWKRRAV